MVHLRFSEPAAQQQKTRHQGTGSLSIQELLIVEGLCACKAGAQKGPNG